MDILTVSLFGNREITDLRRVDTRLKPLIEELMRGEMYVSFLIGRNGEFDEYAASIIKKTKSECGAENCEISLVLPYSVADVDYYERYYDSVIIPDKSCSVYVKAAIKARNRWMIDRSDMVIFYVERTGGGAYDAMKYAKCRNKRCINLYDDGKSGEDALDG